MRRISSSRLRASRFVLLFALALSTPTSAQVRYASGQNVVPVFEGWHKNADGSFDMVFGYMNRNYEQQLDLPVGAGNTMEPGSADQGQPTHFYPRRQQFVFTVRVPKDWGKKDLIWTLKVGDKVEKAYGSLLPFWELGDFVYQENRGSIANITDEPEPNEPPTITLAAKSLTATVGEPIALSATLADDGHPLPRQRPGTPAPPVRRDSDGAVVTPTGTPGPGATGTTGPRRENPLTQAMVRLDPGVRLGVTWVVYRGSAEGVRFDPQRVAAVDGVAQSKVTFARPGTYTLRAYADDTVLLTPADLQVTVR